MGTSTRPVLLILPVREKILVPLLFSVPMEAYQSAPFSTMARRFAKVSTLLIHGGFAPQPAWSWKRRSGAGASLFFPLWRRSGPFPRRRQKRPAPSLYGFAEDNPVPMICSSPRKPFFQRLSKRPPQGFSMARGYSART